MRILIIEDDPKTAGAIHAGLASEGYPGTIAKCGNEGIAHLRADAFDAVLLDWMLPGRDGIEILRHSPLDSLIVARTATRGAEILIEITDQGPGIAPEHREKIFERFYRIDKARSRAEGGTGLGLAIAKLFVEQHGGRIEFASPTAGGSCVRILLNSSLY
jgi:CheY-like chemotaxis protein